MLAPLEHEHIVRLYDYGEDGETPFLVMELVDGANLGDVARDRSFTWEEAPEIARPIASALAYAHARGIVHRDLTPGNVLIESATGRVVVSDFGLARIARSSTSVTTQGMLLGTPEYWSPEQARGRRERERRPTVRARLPALLAALGADAVRGRRPPRGRAAPCPRGGAARSRHSRPDAPARRRRDSSTRCSRRIRPSGRPRSRCSSASVSRRRRSPRRPPARPRPQIATRPSFPAAARDRRARAADAACSRASGVPAAGWSLVAAGDRGGRCASPSSARRSRTQTASSRCRA